MSLTEKEFEAAAAIQKEIDSKPRTTIHVNGKAFTLLQGSAKATLQAKLPDEPDSAHDLISISGLTLEGEVINVGVMEAQAAYVIVNQINEDIPNNLGLTAHVIESHMSSIRAWQRSASCRVNQQRKPSSDATQNEF